jgi:hypothetical protein
LSVECAQGNELFEGGVDTAALDVAMKEAPDLILGQSVVGGLDGFADTVGDRVSGGGAEEEGGARVAVIPYGEGSLEMRQADDGGGVQGGVDGAEGAGPGLRRGWWRRRAGPDGAGSRQDSGPARGRGLPHHGEEDFGSSGGPVESVAEFAGNRGEIAGAEASAFGEAVAALHPGPEAAVGESVLRFGAGEILGELTLGDMGNEADVGSGGLQVLVHPEVGEIAAVPGAAEQRR